MLAQLQKNHPEDLRVVFRHFPLNSIHDKAALASQATEAAGKQGKFWEMHDLIFETQSEWATQGMTVESFQEWLVEKAAELDLDVKQFESDLTSEEIVAKIQKTWDDGVKIGLPGTPFLLFNGRPYQGPVSYGNIDAIIRSILLEQRQYEVCPPMTIDPSRQYIATLHTEKGDIKIQLFAEQAPLAVNNFVFLARDGWYDGVTFHRVLPDFVAQAGDPSGTGYGSPGYGFDNEVSEGLTFDREGLVAMANAGPGTNGSQFFITFGPAPTWNGDYTIFGEVIEGMDVARSLTPRDPQQGMGQAPGDAIESITIEEK